MQVPNSKDGKLLAMLAKAEPKMSGYQVKYGERSGKQLSKFFRKIVRLLRVLDLNLLCVATLQ